jgi:hypothetical protein
MSVSSFNLSQSFNYTPYLFYKKWFKSEINFFCIWTQGVTKRCRLSLLTNSALVYDPKCRGEGGVACGVSAIKYRTVHMEPK